MTNGSSIVYAENQPLTDQPLAWILLPSGLLLLGVAVYAVFEQVVMGKSFGDQPLSDRSLVGFSLLYGGVGVLLLILLLKGRLITEVRSDGVFVRYMPFHRKFRHYAPSQIASAEARDYSPIRDYGGWGLRYSRQGLAYNVSGSRGVQLEFTNGRRLMIGSRHADTLASAIRSVMRS